MQAGFRYDVIYVNGQFAKVKVMEACENMGGEFIYRLEDGFVLSSKAVLGFRRIVE